QPSDQLERAGMRKPLHSSEVFPNIPCIPSRSCAGNIPMQPCKSTQVHRQIQSQAKRRRKNLELIFKVLSIAPKSAIWITAGKYDLILLQALTGFTRVPGCLPPPSPIHTLICSPRRQHGFE
ncbi:hypothetical protein HispidOSU_022083, partial [Sigmodon hispidus]